jgi:hypothetical protein
MSTPHTRGKNKKEVMVHVSVRLPREVVDYYKQFTNPAAVMRSVLGAAAKEEKEVIKDTPESV